MQNKDKRQMIKWRPFSALIEQNEALHQLLEERKQINKPVLSEDMLEEMNYFLLQAKQFSWNVKILYYENHSIVSYHGQITRIDSSNQSLYLKDNQKIHHLYLQEIVGISEKK